MIVKAYAKINLGLHIIGKRTDHYHNIETIFHRINLFDEVNIENSDEISISSSDERLPKDGRNLCWKAVEILRKELGVPHGARINIRKNIPIGAGLGGGSSDAAVVLRTLPVLWNVTADQELLQTCALQIGSDVPYFLHDGSAAAEGRGEQLHPVDVQLPYWIVLVHPKIHISTPWAYGELSKRRNGTFPVRPKILDNFLQDAHKTILSAENDFEPIVFEKHPSIRSIKEKMLSLGAVHSLMSGSGSSVFGLFDDMVGALKAVEHFTSEYFVHLTEPNFTPTGP